MQLSTTLTVSFLALQQFIAAAHRVDHKAAPSVPTNQRLRRAKTVKSDEETVQETAPATTQKGAETVSASDSGKPDKKGDKEDKKKSVESSVTTRTMVKLARRILASSCKMMSLPLEIPLTFILNWSQPNLLNEE